MKQRTVHILTVMVDNEFGVITRITAQIRREGWSIKSLAVSESTDDSAVSRITLALECYAATLPMVLYRISRLACVRSVTAYEPEKYVSREMTLVHINTKNKDALEAMLKEFGATIINWQGDDIVCQLVDVPEQQDVFLERIQKLGATSIARTGAITMEKCRIEQE